MDWQSSLYGRYARLKTQEGGNKNRTRKQNKTKKINPVKPQREKVENLS